MPSVARTRRTSEQVRAEIEQTFGFLPPFFEPALSSPQVLENLWQQTLAAYIENPLSALFKERLNASLSRFCAAPYCIIVHSAALRPLGMTAQQVLALLDAPPLELETALPLGALPVPAPEEAAAPAPDSRLETVLLYCATSVFLERADAPACQAELRRLLGPELYPHLVAYLAYIKTCHTWIEAHPEVSHEADRRAQDNLGPLLAAEPALGDFFRHYQERVRAQGLGRERRRAADESLGAEQARTARLLESITDAFFALDHEWRFTYVNTQAERLLLRPRAELLGKNVWREFPAAVGTDFDRHYHHAVNEQIAVTFEAYYPPPLDAWFEVRAFPSPEGLSVFFQNVNARKALESERERLAERERNISQQLQASLTPAIPEGIPGMALAKCYQAALAEAGVGGDFYDVFPVDKGCTAIVVGDLAGKGLQAASQVATVRNMLRYALYRARTLAGALEGLNALLAEQGLLTGFCTLFVGAYDSGAGTLTFVNAGQEPALIRRAAGGSVEQLAPTGPVLGSFEGAAFEERTVTLGPGDAVAIFTDGLTEVGPSRKQMLGIEGVADLLRGVAIPVEAEGAGAVAEHLALRLIAGVEAAAVGGVMRDDVCLLIAVVE